MSSPQIVEKEKVHLHLVWCKHDNDVKQKGLQGARTLGDAGKRRSGRPQNQSHSAQRRTQSPLVFPWQGQGLGGGRFLRRGGWQPHILQGRPVGHSFPPDTGARGENAFRKEAGDF